MISVVFSKHALTQMRERGATRREVEKALENGKQVSAKKGRLAFRYNFQYNSEWGGQRYSTKQVMPVVVLEKGSYIVITVYTFYF